ncbi:hypothetical protein HLB44_32765 [Aquincola sp. S2]|uniref:Uncharacterized protein n=1 Tax=Pseudaquabacterium terrae TaxID=2732868 RepID=A0ABX2ET34_9BURK|nr:hypothetical protein [Aquabacterium terrae]NRF71768.1 hypothetical protein [Aquabacterium terrae]
MRNTVHLRAAVCAALLAAAALPAAHAEGTVTQKASETATKVGNAIERGAHAAASGVARGVDAAASGVRRGAKAVERGVHAAASGVERGAKATGRAIDTAARKVGIEPSAPASAPSPG